MYIEQNDGTVEIEMTVAEWNVLLAAINHSQAFGRNEDSRRKFSALMDFKNAAQKAVWTEGLQVGFELEARA